MSEKDQIPLIILQPDMMPISLKEYALRHNMPLATVKSQAQREIIPTIQMGKNRTIFVNQALMIVRSLEAKGWNVETNSIAH